MKNMQVFEWEKLLDWYKEHGRHDFPWRQYHHPTPILQYIVWLSEILLQQTQADRVIPFYTRILERYPTIQALSQAEYEEFFPYYQGLGYYSRARNLLRTAKIVSSEYNGVFPQDLQVLKKLPGVGDYTARAILAFGYGEPILAWDTNLETIFSRYYNGSRYIKLSPEQKQSIEKDFIDFVSRVGVGVETISRDTNNALMDWARMMEAKSGGQIDRRQYILDGSHFLKTNGGLEIKPKKETAYFPIPDATVQVILHQDHRIYYSSAGDHYKPFELTAALHRDTRGYVQGYFREQYGLELSVRPVHKKWLSEDGKPYIAVNAQIQTGKPNFSLWDKKGNQLRSR